MIRTRDIDKGYAEFMREVAAMKRKPHVKIGFQGPEAEKTYTNSAATVADVATFNEFGTVSKYGNVHVPARPFIRSTMDEKRGELLVDTYKLIDKIMQGRMTTLKALKILGVKIKGLIQKKIVNLREPPNKPSTVARKRSSNPLIDTGQMRQSVTFKVVGKG